MCSTRQTAVREWLSAVSVGGRPPTPIQGLGFRVQGSGFRVQGLGFGFRRRMQGLGFRF